MFVKLLNALIQQHMEEQRTVIISDTLITDYCFILLSVGLSPLQAARNCLVGENQVIKVSDFGMTR